MRMVRSRFSGAEMAARVVVLPDPEKRLGHKVEVLVAPDTLPEEVSVEGIGGQD
jgi:hypothetical protein